MQTRSQLRHAPTVAILVAVIGRRVNGFWKNAECRAGHGTGSQPPRLKGWQRMIRRRPSIDPRHAPRRRTASMKYVLHVGRKRHCPPSQGDSVTW